jgi:hypothetical protein
MDFLVADRCAHSGPDHSVFVARLHLISRRSKGASRRPREQGGRLFFSIARSGSSNKSRE